MKEFVRKLSMVTFETKYYENDYQHILQGDRLKKMIDYCRYDFAKKVVIINNVADRNKVEALAKNCQSQGTIDTYYFVDDYADEVLKHFHLTKESFHGGYYYSIAELVGLYLCQTPYLLHFSSDSRLVRPASSDWINQAVEMMDQDHRYVCANPFWADRAPNLNDGFFSEIGDWFVGDGFSDQCYLVPTKVFKGQVYGERHSAADRYPRYGGELFEKRVDSYMRNHGLWRLTHKEVRYTHQNFPQKGWRPKVKKVVSTVGGWKYRLAKLLPKVPPSAQALAEYRKTIKVYDVFIFFNELDLLEIRLNILDPYIDYFVIVEATQTFSGRPKKLFFQEQQEQWAQFKDKIIHYVVDDLPDSHDELRQRLNNPELSSLDREIINTCLTSDNVPAGQTHWLREFYQKESMKKPLTELRDRDICFISDVDEIWNPFAHFDFRADGVFKLRQDMYAYYLNNRSSESWAGTYVTKYKNIRNNSLNHLDTPSKTKYRYIKNGGWHFTNLGGVDRIKTKLESYGHQEYNVESIKSQISSKLAKNEDFIGRQFNFWVDESNLPPYLIDHKDQYRSLFKR
ncbi:MAG: hypothetical protein HY092_02705 [Candidatus Kerfeldbacteria bacterium]|nr:hypothetical protein [Candidatus Kerfeldbacteria bacterium]